MIQALYCQLGGHAYEREATRGRQPTSCVDHGGTGIVTRTYRAGSKNGEAALSEHGGTVKGRQSAGVKAREYREKAIPEPRKVPVKVVPESVVDDGDYPIEITLNGGGYRATTTAAEQRALLGTVSTLDTKSEHDPRTEFWCERGQHWAARKSPRGRVPIVCDEHRDPDYQFARAAEYRANAQDRGETVAAGLDGRLRARGVHLSQQGAEYVVEYRWGDSRKWYRFLTLHGAQSKRLWLAKDENAALIKNGSFRVKEVKSA